MVSLRALALRLAPALAVVALVAPAPEQRLTYAVSAEDLGCLSRQYPRWGLDAVQAAAARYKQRLRYHLKIDTGMNRLGFRFDNLRRSLPELIASENLELAAVYTHFATADEPSSALFDQQRVRFDRAIVGPEGGEVDSRNRRSDHAPAARFSKRVYSRMKASLTTPVGPLRCLPMINSATPALSAAGGAFLSA